MCSQHLSLLVVRWCKENSVIFVSNYFVFWGHDFRRISGSFSKKSRKRNEQMFNFIIVCEELCSQISHITVLAESNLYWPNSRSCLKSKTTGSWFDREDDELFVSFCFRRIVPGTLVQVIATIIKEFNAKILKILLPFQIFTFMLRVAKV